MKSWLVWFPSRTHRLSQNLSNAARDGALVKHGDLLFVIDPRPYDAVLEGAPADVVRAQTRLELAVTDFTRGEALFAWTSHASAQLADDDRARLKQIVTVERKQRSNPMAEPL